MLEMNVGTGLPDGPAENSTSTGEFFEYIAVQWNDFVPSRSEIVSDRPGGRSLRC